MSWHRQAQPGLRYSNFFAVDLIDIGVDDRRILDLTAGKVYRNKRHVLPAGRRWSLEPMLKQRTKYGIQGMMNEHGEVLTIGEVIHGQSNWIQLALNNLQGYVVRIVIKERIAYLEQQILGPSGQYEALQRVVDWEELAGYGQVVVGALTCDATNDSLPFSFQDMKVGPDGLVDSRMWNFTRLEARDLLEPTAAGAGFMESLATLQDRRLPEDMGAGFAGLKRKVINGRGFAHPGPDIDAAAWAERLLPQLKKNRSEEPQDGTGFDSFNNQTLSADDQQGGLSVGAEHMQGEQQEALLGQEQDGALGGGQGWGGGGDEASRGNGGLTPSAGINMLMAAAAADGIEVTQGEMFAAGNGGVMEETLVQGAAQAAKGSADVPVQVQPMWHDGAGAPVAPPAAAAIANGMDAGHPLVQTIPKGVRSRGRGPRRVANAGTPVLPPLSRAGGAHADPTAATAVAEAPQPLVRNGVAVPPSSLQVQGSPLNIPAYMSIVQKDNQTCHIVMPPEDPVGHAVAPAVGQIVKHLVDGYISGRDPDNFDKLVKLLGVLPMGVASLRHVLPAGSEGAQGLVEQMFNGVAGQVGAVPMTQTGNVQQAGTAVQAGGAAQGGQAAQAGGAVQGGQAVQAADAVQADAAVQTGGAVQAGTTVTQGMQEDADRAQAAVAPTGMDVEQAHAALPASDQGQRTPQGSNAVGAAAASAGQDQRAVRMAAGRGLGGEGAAPSAGQQAVVGQLQPPPTQISFEGESPLFPVKLEADVSADRLQHQNYWDGYGEAYETTPRLEDMDDFLPTP